VPGLDAVARHRAGDRHALALAAGEGPDGLLDVAQEALDRPGPASPLGAEESEMPSLCWCSPAMILIRVDLPSPLSHGRTRS